MELNDYFSAWRNLKVPVAGHTPLDTDLRVHRCSSQPHASAQPVSAIANPGVRSLLSLLTIQTSEGERINCTCPPLDPVLSATAVPPNDWSQLIFRTHTSRPRRRPNGSDFGSDSPSGGAESQADGDPLWCAPVVHCCFHKALMSRHTARGHTAGVCSWRWCARVSGCVRQFPVADACGVGSTSDGRCSWWFGAGSGPHSHR